LAQYMKGVILIHGLTGTPANMAPLAEGLGRAGFRVITPLLAGHGTCVENLLKTRLHEWVASVSRAYDELSRDCEEIYCAGQSLGALLTLNMALDDSRSLKKIACMGTPLRLSPLLAMLLLPISHIPPIRQLIRYSKKDWSRSVADGLGREMYKNSSYDRIPIPSVWELQKLQRDILKRLGELRVPSLLIHSKLDKVAPPFNVGLFCKKAINITPKVLWLHRSEHVILLDHERDIVVQEIANFFS